jgi:deoxyadenosine/deoxycytidine kinase/dUTPase
MARVRIVTIEGNIGAGKSTLLTALREHINNVVFVKEPVDEWDSIRDEEGVTILKKFYMDPAAYAFSFQMMAFISRLVILKNAVAHAKERSIAENSEILVVSERSLLTDRNVFAAMLRDMGHLEDIDFAIYTRWFSAFASEFDVNDVVYLDVTPETCAQRVQSRARPGEDPISLDYLRQCGEYHARFIGGLVKQNKHVATIKEDMSREEWTQRVLTFLSPINIPVSPPILRRNSIGQSLMHIHRTGSQDNKLMLSASIDLYADRTHIIPSGGREHIGTGTVIEWNSYAISPDHATYLRIGESDSAIPNTKIEKCILDDKTRGVIVVDLTNTGTHPITIDKGTPIAKAVMVHSDPSRSSHV